MIMGGKCDYPVCPGGHCKFCDCQTEALYALSLSVGMYDDGQTGSTDFDVYAVLFCFPEAAQFSRENTGMDFDVYIPAGTFWIVKVNDQGYVWSATYPDHVSAENAFSEIDRAYAAWSERNGE